MLYVTALQEGFLYGLLALGIFISLRLYGQNNQILSGCNFFVGGTADPELLADAFF